MDTIPIDNGQKRVEIGGLSYEIDAKTKKLVVPDEAMPPDKLYVGMIRTMIVYDVSGTAPVEIDRYDEEMTAEIYSEIMSLIDIGKHLM